MIGQDFSDRVERCSFLTDGINPFHRDGVKIETLDVEVLEDPTQETAAAIIDQVAQGSLLRVVMPWMIGRAFEKIGDPAFLDVLGKEKQFPVRSRFYLRAVSSARDKKGAGAGCKIRCKTSSRATTSPRRPGQP